MLFNSFEFIFFFIATLVFYWIIRDKYKWILLLIASYFFYMSWNPAYIVLIIVSTLIDYLTCLKLTSSENINKKKLGLGISIVLNLSLLFSFKYLNFFIEITNSIFHIFGVNIEYNELSILLPVGISFYTFQTLSYSIDVYKNKITVEKHLGKFALFVSFFPQLIAGPIERANDLIPQFDSKKKLSYQNVYDGLLLFVWGLFKKIVVADNVAEYVDAYYNNFEMHNGGTLLFATYLFAIQIYCDFSGYSDMAIGVAKLMGFELKENFKTPYFSKTISQFWGNWHITFVSWLKDYIYIPLGGNRTSKIKKYRNLIITTLTSGFWHGAGWNFIFWGLLNGILLTFESIITGLIKIRLKFNILKIFIVFNIICFTHIFFRSQSLNQAFIIIQKILTLTPYDFYFIIADNKFSNAVIACILLILIEFLFPFKSILTLKEKKNYVKYPVYIVLIFAIILLSNTSGNQFIYFQF